MSEAGPGTIADTFWPERPPSALIRLGLPLAVIGCVVVGVLVVMLTYRPPPTMSGAELQDYFADKYIEVWHFERNWTARSDTELDGSGVDFWAGDDNSGRWWIEDDTLCFDWSGGSGCWRVARGPGERVYWYTLDGDYDGTDTVRRSERSGS
ncbi:MAG: hypothetical protein AAF563_12070 [Pseudomonadota bacterium]